MRHNSAIQIQVLCRESEKWDTSKLSVLYPTVIDVYLNFEESSGINVMVLYPEEGISNIQKLQMTSAPGQNVSVIGMYSRTQPTDTIITINNLTFRIFET